MFEQIKNQSTTLILFFFFTSAYIFPRYNVIVKGFSGTKITKGIAFILVVVLWVYSTCEIRNYLQRSFKLLLNSTKAFRDIHVAEANQALKPDQMYCEVDHKVTKLVL